MVNNNFCLSRCRKAAPTFAAVTYDKQKLQRQAVALLTCLIVKPIFYALCNTLQNLPRFPLHTAPIFPLSAFLISFAFTAKILHYLTAFQKYRYIFTRLFTNTFPRFQKCQSYRPFWVICSGRLYLLTNGLRPFACTSFQR